MLKISDHESDNFENDQKPNGMSNTEFKLIDYNLECLGLITDDACVVEDAADVGDGVETDVGIVAS